MTRLDLVKIKYPILKEICRQYLGIKNSRGGNRDKFWYCDRILDAINTNRLSEKTIRETVDRVNDPYISRMAFLRQLNKSGATIGN